MGAPLNIGTLLQSAGPSAALVVVIGLVVWLWLRAERHANEERKRAKEIQDQLDAERERNVKLIDGERSRRWKAEDAAAKARRKAGDVDA